MVWKTGDSVAIDLKRFVQQQKCYCCDFDSIAVSDTKLPRNSITM